MPTKMELHFNQRVFGPGGAIVTFVANEPLDVPDFCVEACLAAGARAVDKDLRAAPPKQAENKYHVAPSGIDRIDAIKESLAKIKLKNNADDFAATGRPKTAVIVKDVGFKIDAQEVAKIWEELNGSGDE